MSKDLFSRYNKARNLIDSVVPDLAVYLHRRKISPDKLFSSENIELFNKHLNSVNVLSILVLERDFSSEKEITANDAYDMAHLSGAIPYCNVIVTERMFAHISKKMKLDVTYNCVISSDLKDLVEIEPIKSKIRNLKNC